MRVAFIGTRGVPAAYSGFETFVEELGGRLVERGHDVTVYCRRHFYEEHPSRHRGMRLIHVPGVASKHLDTFTHTASSTAHALSQRYDAVIMCISGNSPFAVFPRMVGTRVVLNVDGSDWRRRKWGALARAYIRASEWIATRAPDVTVTDSEVMQRFYRESMGAETECIAYGADLPEPQYRGMLERMDLQPRGYFLLVGRLVPENCAHHLVEAYESLRPPLRCVIVGDAPYAERYIADLKRRGPHVDFPGYVFGDGYRELVHNAFATVLCSEVGGTHPVLVEAMSAGSCVIVNDTPANMEVIDNAGLSYDGSRGSAALAEVMAWTMENESIVEDYRRRAGERALANYSWDAVTDQYEQLLHRVLKNQPVEGLARTTARESTKL